MIQTQNINTLQTRYTDHHTFTVFPESLNYSGSLFGGKLLSEMDLAASNAARKMLYRTDCDGLVTAHVGAVDFKAPGNLGDIVTIISTVTDIGRTSISVQVIVRKEDRTGNVEDICEANFVFVALRKGAPFPHGLILNEFDAL